MKKKSDVIKIIESHAEEIKHLGVKRLGLFGSFARRSQTKKSDVDILVEFRRGQKTFDNFMDLKHLLERKLRRKVDLVTQAALKTSFKTSIQKDLSYAGF